MLVSQELLNAALSNLQLRLESDIEVVGRRNPLAIDDEPSDQFIVVPMQHWSLEVARLQLDNLLPTSHHPVALRTPSRAAAVSGTNRGALSCGSSVDASRASSVAEREFAVRIRMERPTTGQLQLLHLEVRPLEVALEASLLVRVGRLLGTARRSAAVGVGRAALVSHLSAVLEEPPDWSRREPLFCDVLRVEPVSVQVVTGPESVATLICN